MARLKTYSFSGFLFEILESGSTIITATSFQPRREEAIDHLQSRFPKKKVFFLQRPDESIQRGSLFSKIYYTPTVEFYSRPWKINQKFRVEYGISGEGMDSIMDLAIANNKDEVIFPQAMLEQFSDNTQLIGSDGLSVQVYDEGRLIGHVSVIKKTDEFWGNVEIYWLLRFIVAPEYRGEGGLKEFLIQEVKGYLPERAPLALQIFPNNTKAQRFFSRRINIIPYYEKWMVS